MMKPNKPGAASVHKPGWFVTGGQTGGDDVPLLCYKDCGVQGTQVISTYCCGHVWFLLALQKPCLVDFSSLSD